MTDIIDFRPLLAGVFAAALTACGASDGTSGAPQQRSERAVQIVPHQISMEEEVSNIQAVGTARARSFASIFPETAGEVVEVNFEAGDLVQNNQVLVRLESRKESLAVQQAEVALADAKRLIDRYNSLSAPGAISQNELDRADVAYKAAEIQLDVAREALADRTVRAPFKGYVGLSDIDPGARITTSTEITKIDDREVLYVDFPAPEQTFSRISPGDIIRVEPFSAPGTFYDAEIQTTDSSINPTTRAFTVRAAIDNSDDKLRPGMSFRIGFNLPGETLPVVPEASIVWGGDGSFLWAVEDGRAKRVPVTIVSRKEGRVLVRGDLKDGDWIVEEGVHKVRQGAPVEMPNQSLNYARPRGGVGSADSISAAQP